MTGKPKRTPRRGAMPGRAEDGPRVPELASTPPHKPTRRRGRARAEDGPPLAPAGPVAPARRHVTPPEAKRLIDAAGQPGRHTVRDRCLIMVMFHHGLRVAEAIGLQWHDIAWTTAHMHVRRVKGGKSSTHPIIGDELRALRALKRENAVDESFVFLSEWGVPMSPDAVARIIARAGVIAGLGFHVHPHMLRHGCGYMLANRGHDTRIIQDYLGHKQISSTVIYTALSPTRFRNLF